MKAKSNLWAKNRKTFLVLIVMVMIVAIGVSFISYFKVEQDEEDTETESDAPYASMHNASRYFFRVFYPDDWNVNADQFGFMLDSKTGLVLELFPLKKMSSASPGPDTPASASPTASAAASAPASASASPDPRAGMERDGDLTVSFYYKDYGGLMNTDDTDTDTDTDAEASPEVSQPSQDITPSSPDVTPSSQGSREPPLEHKAVASAVFDEFKASHAEEKYTFSAQSVYSGKNVSFTVLPYEYIKDDIKMSGEIYVATRAMAYYVIQAEGTSAAFGNRHETVRNILNNMIFSVFDY